MHRRLSVLAMAGAVMLVMPSTAFAAGATANTATVVGASATVTSCGSLSGMSISWTVTANVVTSIALASIPSACNGASLSLTLVDASNASLGSVGPVTVSGTSMSLTPSGTPTATSVANSYVSMVGP
jgi:hypothetical protein